MILNPGGAGVTNMLLKKTADHLSMGELTMNLHLKTKYTITSFTLNGIFLGLKLYIVKYYMWTI